jgi:hypothetical protein
LTAWIQGALAAATLGLVALAWLLALR